MAINDATGSITHNYKDVAEVLSSTSSKIESITGGVKYAAGSGAGYENFAGISEDKIGDFETAINNYELKINEIIRGFNAVPNMEKALKGSVSEAALEFLQSIKQLLERYVQAIEIEKREIREANANWKQASSTISGNISSDSSQILSEANNVTIE